MNGTLTELVRDLPRNLSNHLLISMLPLLLGLVISIPLAIVAARHARMRYPLLTVVSVVQTIPSLALLALMVPLLIGVNRVGAPLTGIELPTLGFLPVVIALTLYSMLPMVRNTVTGILDVDPALTEAARGVGMTDRQSLWRVELPLALPVIIAGIRTATVWTVGIATLATPVGQRCLGNYIFAGLQTRNWSMVVFGCIVSAILAITLDLLIGGLQTAAEERRSGLGWLSGGLLAVLMVCGLVAPTVVDRLMRPTVAGVAAAEDVEKKDVDRSPIIIGSKTFTEQYILQELIADVLSDAGIQSRQKESLGSTIAFDALTANEIDCYVDYSGTIWANYMKREEVPAPWKAVAEVTGWLAREHDVRCLGQLGFENAYALAMRRDRAEELGIETISDLTEHAPDMAIGADYEFFSRPEWESLRDAYGLRFKDRVTYDSTFMYEAVDGGKVDVIAAFSSDGRIETFDLVLLEDPKQAIPPYDALILLSPRAAQRPEVAEALLPLLREIKLSTMQHANYLVDRDEDKQSPSEAARWLREEIGVGKEEAEKAEASE